MPGREVTPLGRCERDRNLVSTCSGRKARLAELPTSPLASRRLAFTRKQYFTCVIIWCFPLSMYEQRRVQSALTEHQAVLTIRAFVAAARTAKRGRA